MGHTGVAAATAGGIGQTGVAAATAGGIGHTGVAAAGVDGLAYAVQVTSAMAKAKTTRTGLKDEAIICSCSLGIRETLHRKSNPKCADYLPRK